MGEHIGNALDRTQRLGHPGLIQPVYSVHLCSNHGCLGPELPGQRGYLLLRRGPVLRREPAEHDHAL